MDVEVVPWHTDTCSHTHRSLIQLETVFSPQATQKMWIGLNDMNSEGTLIWVNGEDYYFSPWDSYRDDNYDSRDCVVLNDDNFKFRYYECDSDHFHGYICMKGSICKLFIIFCFLCLSNFNTIL